MVLGRRARGVLFICLLFYSDVLLCLLFFSKDMLFYLSVCLGLLGSFSSGSIWVERRLGFLCVCWDVLAVSICLLVFVCCA